MSLAAQTSLLGHVRCCTPQYLMSIIHRQNEKDGSGVTHLQSELAQSSPSQQLLHRLKEKHSFMSAPPHHWPTDLSVMLLPNTIAHTLTP
jgi:hypothetical protein